MKYRSDIDGLRALAVLPVLFYHGGMSLFSGGYVGVDIFFVISGYLITGVIVEEINKNTFTISNFYLRRVKRIFPALFFVMLATVILCLFFMLPYDFRSFGKSLAATVFFISNFFFNQQSGYFSDDVESMPLLHTWSLSVEEQFYIFYPIMLMLIFKYFGRQYVRYVFALFIISFAVSVYTVAVDESTAFYMLHTRAWELFSGALLALGAFPKVKSRALNEFLGFAGLVSIAVSVSFYTVDTKFPGVSAVLPCLGAFLIIYSGSGPTYTARLLSMRPLVFIGLLSYSLYLWHWPLLAIYNAYKPVFDISEGVLQGGSYALLILSFILSVFTYKYIETPFRKIKPQNLSLFFKKTVAIMTVIALIGGTFYWTRGLKFRFPNAVVQIDNGFDEIEKMVSCKDRKLSDFTYDSIRRIGADEKTPDFIVMGDSHAGAFYPGFDKMGRESGRTGLLVSKNDLVPLYGFGHKSKECHKELIIKTIDIIKAHESIKDVFLIGRWVKHIAGKDGGYGINGEVYDYNHVKIPVEQIKGFMQEQFINTIGTLEKSGKSVYVMAGVPEIYHDVPGVMGKSAYLREVFGVTKLVDFRPTVEEHRKYQKDIYDIMAVVSDKTGATVLRPENVLLNGDKYELVSNNRANYMDNNHLTTHGAELIVTALWSQVFGE